MLEIIRRNEDGQGEADGSDLAHERPDIRTAGEPAAGPNPPREDGRSSVDRKSVV